MVLLQIYAGFLLGRVFRELLLLALRAEGNSSCGGGSGNSFSGRCPGEGLSEEYQNLGTTPEERGTVKHPANRRTAKNIDRFIGVAELVN